MLYDLWARAARGGFPPADGGVDVVPAVAGAGAIVAAFTAHSVIAADVPPEEILRRLDPDDLGATFRIPFLAWLAHRVDCAPGIIDAILVAPPPAAPRIRLLEVGGREHPRIARALEQRSDVRVWTDETGAGVVTIGRGLTGRLEIGLEVDAAARHRGLGRALASQAAALAGNEPLFAQVAPGNAASLRCFQAAGWRPLGVELSFVRVPNNT